jgi:hypothetical protein
LFQSSSDREPESLSKPSAVFAANWKLAAGSTQIVAFALRYTAAADIDDSDLEITGTGAGVFHVGAVSLMPADTALRSIAIMNCAVTCWRTESRD